MFAVLAYSILTLSVDRGAGFVSIFSALVWLDWFSGSGFDSLFSSCR